MWNRQRLKCNARVLLKANYLKVVVVGLILSFLIGSGYNSARGAAKSNDVDIDVTDLFSRNLAFIVAMLIGIAGVIAIALLFNESGIYCCNAYWHRRCDCHCVAVQCYIEYFSVESVGSRMPKSLCRLQIWQCRME